MHCILGARVSHLQKLHNKLFFVKSLSQLQSLLEERTREVALHSVHCIPHLRCPGFDFCYFC